MTLNFPSRIENGGLLLRKVESADKQFIIDFFKEVDIAANYVVAADIKKNYGNLVTLWLLMTAQKEGFAWIIEDENTQRPKPCGFIVSELANSDSAVMISYALSQKFRKKGIITKSVIALEKKTFKYRNNII